MTEDINAARLRLAERQRDQLAIELLAAKLQITSLEEALVSLHARIVRLEKRVDALTSEAFIPVVGTVGVLQ